MVNTCRYCNAPISWMQGPNGKSKPVNPDGSGHHCQSTRSAEPIKEPQTEAYIPTAAPVAPVPLVIAPQEKSLNQKSDKVNDLADFGKVNNETTVRQVSVRPDSLEIGTPGKNGALKIFMDFSDPADCEARIRTAVAMRELANQLITAPLEMVRA